MKIIIVGLGKVGQKLAERLSQEKEHSITVIDLRQPVLTDIVNAHDVMGITGSGASMDVLEEAGIRSADILIAVTESDELNLLTCFLARKLGSCNTIARVRNPEYKKEIQLFREDLGLAMIINPELIAAEEIARLLRFPSAVQIDTFAKGRVEILKFKIASNSPLCDLKLLEISQKLGCNILICGVERGDEAFIPRGDFMLKAGDYVSVVGTVRDATQFIKKIGLKTGKVKNSMIVGGGETAVYLANHLMKAGIEVTVVEQNPDRCDELCFLLPKATIINGDGTENRLLMEEGIDSAESFVALTNMDEANVMLSLYAKTRTEGKIITKINRTAYDEVISNLGLDTIIYPKDLTAEYILRFVRAKNNSIGSNIETMHEILDGKAEALEFNILKNAPVANKTLETLPLKQGVIIACINRQGNIITPRGKDMLLPGDTVIVVTSHKGFSDISDILR
ncbi:MAG: Trk system potassium transporter TrkA [Clostridia bacterium]|nr:Trk system potassium transporter TrkA [Clostridia bacterium]